MGKTTKILLALSLAGFGAGLVFVTDLIKAQESSWLYVALPTGAICFGLFLISKLLEKETALFDQEQRMLLASAERLSNAGCPSPRKDARPNSARLNERSLVAENAS